MTIRILLLSLIAALLTACNSSSPTPVITPGSRVYNGTASVGDFMTITINSAAQTIAYNDVSNNTSGTVPYTVNANGTYALNDPTGNLLSAYEVPNYAVLIQAAKTGPNANTPALITAVESSQISLSTFEGQAYNYMQFRTASGGMEVGSVTIGSQGTGAISSYWPYGSYNQDGQGPFGDETLNMTTAVLSPSGTFLTVSDPGGSGASDYVFGTANGIFAVDTANGAILGLAKAATANFNSSTAGTYTASYYQKKNASTGAGNVETGAASLGSATVVVSSTGQVTITDSNGHQMAQGTLTPVANASWLYGSSGQLTDPCNGLFTFRSATANSQQDVFVAFMGQAMLFSSFTANLPWSNNGTYNYFYGVGLLPSSS